VEPANHPVLRLPGEAESEKPREEVEACEDTRLLAGVAAGDPHALERLYQRRGGLLHSLVLRMLVHETEAQETMQDTFVQLWRRAGGFDPARSAPLPWMIMIARGLAVDRIRARSRRSATQTAYEQEVALVSVESINGFHQTDRDERATACASALNALPEAQGRVLQLAFLRGWTHEEIAHAENEPLGTIKARIRRGLLALRRVLQDHHD
jgi:RNA polymerase sigma-70 factor (ECF subfamily)